MNNQEKYELDEFNYIMFILGYDLLQNYFAKSEDNECDLVFTECIHITDDFLASNYNNTNKSVYECLQEYINEVYLKEVV